MFLEYLILGLQEGKFNMKLLILQQKQVAFARTLVQLILKSFILKVTYFAFTSPIEQIINNVLDISMVYMYACTLIIRNQQQ